MAGAVWRGVGGTLRSLGQALDGLGCVLQGRLAYRETLSKAQTVQPFAGKAPQVGQNVFVAPSASVIGDVKLGDGSSVWYGAVIRGDVNSVTIGSRTNIQDNVLVHVARKALGGVPLATIIGSNVTIGHGAVVHAATIEDCALVGMGATVMDGARVERGAVVAAGALVPPGAVVPSGEVWAGSPARRLRALDAGEAEFVAAAAEDYAGLAAVHAAENAKTFLEVETDKARREHRLQTDPEHDQQMGFDRDVETREVLASPSST